MPAIGLYLRLSGFYFFYFASLGVFLPYWSLYLQSVGIEPLQIGVLVAATLGTKLVAPYLWGWLADRAGRRMSIIRSASAVALVCFAGVFLQQGFLWLLGTLLLFSFFWNASLPQFEAVTLNHLGRHVHRYSFIRLWGSVGFVVTSIACGPLFQRAGIGWVPLCLILTLVGIWAASLSVPETSVDEKQRNGASILPVLRRPEVVALFAVCFLIQASHGPYYGFYSIYLEAHGLTRGAIGSLWSLGVIAEVGVFLLMSRLLPRYGSRALMLLSLALTTIRWLLIAWYVDSMMALLVAQLLHAFSFGMYHAVAIYLVNRFFAAGYEGRGQALYSSLSFGAGGALGALASGYLWETVGPEMTFALAAMTALAGWVVCWLGLEPTQRAASWRREKS